MQDLKNILIGLALLFVNNYNNFAMAAPTDDYDEVQKPENMEVIGYDENSEAGNVETGAADNKGLELTIIIGIVLAIAGLVVGAMMFLKKRKAEV